MSSHPLRLSRRYRRPAPRLVAVIASLLAGILAVPWLAGIGGTGQVGAISAAQNPYVERALLTPPAAGHNVIGAAISADGTTAVVGYDNNAVSVYGISGNTYRQIGPTLTEPSGPAANDSFGESVAVSGDGATVVVGNTFHHSQTRAGAVYVYTRVGNAYVVLGGAPIAVADATYVIFGLKVMVSGDGATVVILAEDTNGRATALVYTKSGGVYSRQQAIGPIGGIALSTDGTTLATSNLDAHVTVYVRGGGTYSQFGGILSPSDPLVAGNGFGGVPAVSGDGATVAIRADKSALYPQQRVAYLFAKGVSGYSQIQEIAAGTNAVGGGVNGVALNGDGTTLTLGITHDTITQESIALIPTINVYRKGGATYSLFENGVIAFPATRSADKPYGVLLGISGDGGTILAATDYDDPVAILNESPIAGVGARRNATWNLANAMVTTPDADLAFPYTSGHPETPLLCDWSGTNAKQPGVFTAFGWYIDGTRYHIDFGQGGDIPLCGDWTGSGKQTIGVYRSGVFYLKNSNTSGNSADIVVGFGQAGDIPVVGDWTGQGKQTVGVYRNGVFYLLNNNVSSATADIVVGFGQAGDVPVVGDWTGGGIESIGVFRNGAWYLRNTNTPGAADTFFLFGTTGDVSLVRSERANGVAGPGIQPRVVPTAVKGTATVTRNAATATATPGKGTATPNPLPPSR